MNEILSNLNSKKKSDKLSNWILMETYLSVESLNNVVVNRYVRALFEVSVGREADFLNQIKAVRVAIKSLKDGKKVLRRFSLMINEGEIFVNTLISELELFKEIGNFLKLILYNKRFTMILDFCEAFEKLYKKMNDSNVFYITYAKEFTERNRSELTQYLQELVDGNIEFIVRKDESLIGGLQIRYGAKLLDYSVKSKLDRLKKALKGE